MSAKLFPWDSFPYRLDFTDKSRVAWFECQEHMDKEIARCNLKSKDYKASCKRGYKIIKPEKPKTQKRKNLKRSEVLNPEMKTLRSLTFEKQPKLLNVNHV